MPLASVTLTMILFQSMYVYVMEMIINAFCGSDMSRTSLSYLTVRNLSMEARHCDAVLHQALVSCFRSCKLCCASEIRLHAQRQLKGSTQTWCYIMSRVSCDALSSRTCSPHCVIVLAFGSLSLEAQESCVPELSSVDQAASPAGIFPAP
jgi:hypothetical protein